MKCSLLVLTACFLASGCNPGSQQTAGPDQPGKFTTGEPQTIISCQQMLDHDLHLDAGLYVLNDGGQWKWFGSNLFWDVLYSIGPKDNPLDSIVVSRGPYRNMPEAHSYNSNTDMGDHTWGNCIWIGNVYRNPENGHIIAFNHIEYNAKEGMGAAYGNRSPDYFRFALTISKDGGKSFEWCGYMISPNLSYETWLKHWFPRNQAGGNMGLCNYITRDGFFYMYYADTEDSPDTLIRGTAVARCKIDDVLQAAENYQVAPWKKYNRGKWNEPGLGGRFTALNLPPVHSIHGDAAYNSYLDKYVLVTLSTDHQENDQFTGGILISFSEDGMIWSDWQEVHRDGHWHVYPSIISTGDDNEVIGKSFWVYFQYFERAGDRSGPNRWDRVLVTME